MAGCERSGAGGALNVPTGLRATRNYRLYNGAIECRLYVVDAIVVDVPTGFYLTAVEVPEATLSAQFAAPGGDQWGALLEKDSPLTDCVSAAIAPDVGKTGRSRGHQRPVLRQ